jgi:hypothetical protein
VDNRPVYWIYGLPSWLLGSLFCVIFVAFSAGGVLLVGPRVRKAFAGQEGWREHVSITLEAAFVFVGLLLALVALASYDNYTEARTLVSSEASAAGTLYRDATAYPEPTRGVLQSDIDQYLQRVITYDWPLQRRGIVPTGEKAPGRIVAELAGFQPANASESALTQVSLAQANTWLAARRERLDIIDRGLPATLWVVLVLGAIVNIVLTWLLPIESTRGHLILSGAFALVVALILFVTASMDHPFRGSFSVSPAAFELVHSDVIAPTAETGG